MDPYILADDNDFKKFFGMTFSEIEKYYEYNHFKHETYNKFLAQHFNSIVTDQNNEKQLFEYYNSMEFCVAQLIWYFKNNLKHYIEKNDFNSRLDELFFGSRKPISILDYGCGTGEHSLKYLTKGYDVTFVDLPTRLFNFLSGVIGKRFLRSNFLTVDQFNNLVDKNYYIAEEKEVDLLICCEVLEHIPEPLEVLNRFFKILKPFGFMNLSTFFNHMGGHDTSHLVQNTERYENCQGWHQKVFEVGFNPIAYNEGGSMKVWQKVCEDKFVIENFIRTRT